MENKEEPDSARSWAICLAGFVINTMLSGISRTTGLFYVAILDTYGVSRLQANLPFTIRNIVRNIGGPLVGIIGQKYGARDVTIAGGVLASLGILLCAFVPDIVWISFLWGGMHGVGVSLGNTLYQIIVTQYFVKYRTTASGLSACGACLGSIFFPVMIEYSLSHVGLSRTFLITAGLMLHCIPAGLLMKAPPWITKSQNMMAACPKKKTSSTEANGIDNLGFVDVQNSRNADKSSEGTEQVSNSIWLQPNVPFVSREDVTPPKESDLLQEISISKGIIRMCRDPMFLMISLSLAAFAMLFDPAATVIVDYLMDKGMAEDLAKYFLSFLAVADLFGRLCFGWVTDKNYLSIAKFMMLLQVVQGLCFLLMPSFHSFGPLLTVTLVYGVASGVSSIMFAVLVGKYPQWYPSFTVPPLIGYFRDNVGSYDGLFYVTGALSVIIGLLWLLEPVCLKSR